MITIRVDHNLCKGCGLCIVNCPQNVLEEAEEPGTRGYYNAVPVRPEDCSFCHLCERVCPDLAISVRKEGEE